MTKGSQKHFRQWRKKNTGCMRGLISIFDFRQGRSSQRLLSNKSCGSVSNNSGFSNARNKVDLPCKLEEDFGDIRSVINVSDTESDEAVMVNPYISSISTLIEKEMSTAHHSRKEFSSKVKWINTEFGTGANDKEATKNAALSETKLNASSNFMSQQSDHPDMSTILSSEFDLSTFMLDYCSNFLDCEKTPLERRSKTAKQPFKSRQNQFLGEQPVTKMFQKQNDLRKKEKTTAVYQSNESNDPKDLDQIVVLKPTQVRNQNISNAIAPVGSISSHCGVQNKQGGESLSFHFSLKEIRKRFGNVIGTNRKEKHPIAMDGVLHKIPYGKQITSSAENGGEQRLDTYEKKNAFSVDSKISPKKLSKNSTPTVLYTEATFCDEARKHLSDFLRIGSERESFPPTHVSRTLGKILSFPGFNYLSPRLSPAREKGQALQENRSLLLHRSKEKIDSEHLDIFGRTDKNLEFKKEIMDDIEIEEIMQSETLSVSISNEDDFAIEELYEEGSSSMLLETEQSEARFEPSSPSTPTASKLPVLQESKEIIRAMDDADRPSPISVLDPLFFEDINTPASMLSWRLKETNAKTQKQPREFQIGSSVAALCLTDAETDSILCTKFDESLLFDELEVSYNMHIDDPRLLFDSIDEVLTEIKDRHFSFASQLSCIKSNIIIPVHKHEYFMKEACRRIDWHLDVQLPNTLEKTVKKDLDSTVWIDLQFGAENTVSKIGDSILDCLFEEIALELWD